METLIKNIARELNQTQDSLDKMDGEVKQRAFDRLPIKMQHMLDELWGQLYSDKGRKNIPQSDGCWSGEAGNSIWMPNRDCVPPNKGYSNMHLKTWGRILDENHIESIRFIDGRADFSPITDIAITQDWELLIGNEGLMNLCNTGNREQLHEAAFEQMRILRGYSDIQEARAYKEKRNLVWHEEPDCHTLRLIPREVHDNIKHFGGIAMLQIVIKNI